MPNTHLTARDLETYLGGARAETADEAMARHLADCASCRARLARAETLERELRALPRQDAPHDLADRIVAAVDWRVAMDETRRRQLPYVAFATVAAIAMAFWFAFQMILAFIDHDALDFLSLYTQRPDLLSTYFSDALFALVESLPLLEIALTLIAVAIAVVLAQQLRESVRPRAAH